MSVLVGIDCNDCVILATSGSAPKSATGASGAARPSRSELRAIAAQAVIGYSGPEELGREVTAALEGYLADQDPGELEPEAHRHGIQAALSQPVRLAAAMTRALGRLPGGVSEGDETVGETMIALSSRGRHALFVVDEECAVTLVGQGASCAVIGPAKPAAESFLRLLQRLLWREGKPSRAAGQLAAYWTARHITDVEGGSSRSVQLARFSVGDGKAADIVWYGERVIASLRRAVDAGADAIRSELKRSIVIDHEGLGDDSASTLEQPIRRRVPEVRVTLGRPQGEQRKPRW